MQDLAAGERDEQRQVRARAVRGASCGYGSEGVDQSDRPLALDATQSAPQCRGGAAAQSGSPVAHGSRYRFAGVLGPASGEPSERAERMVFEYQNANFGARGRGGGDEALLGEPGDGIARGRPRARDDGDERHRRSLGSCAAARRRCA